MHLIIIGSEYSGKTTLAKNISEWWKRETGDVWVGFHDHFVLPYVEGEGDDVDMEAEQVRALRPGLQEKYSRYMCTYHLGHSFYADNNHMLIDWFYGDAVYAPIYYKFGQPGQYADRHLEARHYENEINQLAPDSILVLLKASPEVIRRRMAQQSNPRGVLQEADVEKALAGFQREFDDSLLRRRMEIDTSDRTPEETLAEFCRLIEPHLTDHDRLRLMTRKLLG
jgi:thymidylate kinase